VASSVRYPDPNVFFTSWFRARLAARPEPYCSGFSVDINEPGPNKPFPPRLLVVRSDGMTRTSFATAEITLGLSILAGTTDSPKDAIDAALMVLALAEQLPAVEPGNPVTALIEANGPFAVDEEQDRARQYLTLDLALAGIPF